jgi:hypothetical protein
MNLFKRLISYIKSFFKKDSGSDDTRWLELIDGPRYLIRVLDRTPCEKSSHNWTFKRIDDRVYSLNHIDGQDDLLAIGRPNPFIKKDDPWMMWRLEFKCEHCANGFHYVMTDDDLKKLVQNGFNPEMNEDGTVKAA